MMDISTANNVLTHPDASADELMQARAHVKDELRKLERQPTLPPGAGAAELKATQEEREAQVEALTQLYDKLHSAVQQRLSADALERGREIAGQIEAALLDAEEARQAYRRQVDDLARLGWELSECKRLAPELGLGGGTVRRIMALEPVPSQHAMRFERGVKG